MTTKLFEVRDRATTMSCLGIHIDPKAPDLTDRERLLLARAGYIEGDCVLFGEAQGGHFFFDSFDWSGRTLPVAHDHIIKNWESLKSGDIIDVEFILGETDKPKETDL